MTIRGGTVAYVPPEVWKEQPSGREVDVWSLGCIMHLLLRGVLPFDGKTPLEVKQRTLNKQLDLTTHPQWENAKDLLTKMLIKDPKHRIDVHEAMAHPWFADIEKDALQVHTNLQVSSFLNSKPVPNSTSGLETEKPEEHKILNEEHKTSNEEHKTSNEESTTKARQSVNNLTSRADVSLPSTE
ncbi:hypothetical protein RFI_07139 [Reticulomyxa filosa]|uniref:Protein kinase domain-containing protein n=1 Tax=Reticulomyxa filosa TaxID=46433 RepID=X6NXI7_RETFI|nr:hypothetical protein RFI_07139 [Reticulomyxa filosa]|eukprot:ETO29982.1 hypothetical protein RFI_07139 [Reticulomyxa filosa]